MAWNGPVAPVVAEDAARAAKERDDVDALAASVRMQDVDRNFRCGVDSGVIDASPGTALVLWTITTVSTDLPKGKVVPMDWLVHRCGAAGANIVPERSTFSTPPARRD